LTSLASKELISMISILVINSCKRKVTTLHASGSNLLEKQIYPDWLVVTISGLYFTKSTVES